MSENALIQKIKPTVAASPHMKSGETSQTMMRDVIIALVPALAASVWLFGPRALIVNIVSVVSCVLFEYVTRKILKRRNTLSDLSAVVTGLLLAFNLPSTIPMWMIPIGAFVAIVVVKQFFGGIGQNFVNPAMTARIILMVSFPTAMAKWVTPFQNCWSADAVTSATPMATLASAKGGDLSAVADILPSLTDMLLGKHGGSMGEVCSIALICGGFYLILRRKFFINFQFSQS